ncbi:MAG: hypothetical protein ABJC05_04090 [Pyrinomonadaceae bacterium]
MAALQFGRRPKAKVTQMRERRRARPAGHVMAQGQRRVVRIVVADVQVEAGDKALPAGSNHSRIRRILRHQHQFPKLGAIFH